MLDKNFSTDWLGAILGNLRDNNYLTQDDVNILEREYPNIENIDKEKAEIVRKAVSENSKRKSN